MSRQFIAPMFVREARSAHRSGIRSEVWLKTHGECWYCGEGMNPFQDFTIDHIVPLSRGGTNAVVNLVPACRSCNAQKGSKTIEEYRAALARRFRGEMADPEDYTFAFEQPERWWHQ